MNTQKDWQACTCSGYLGIIKGMLETQLSRLIHYDQSKNLGINGIANPPPASQFQPSFLSTEFKNFPFSSDLSKSQVYPYPSKENHKNHHYSKINTLYKTKKEYRQFNRAIHALNGGADGASGIAVKQGDFPDLQDTFNNLSKMTSQIESEMHSMIKPSSKSHILNGNDDGSGGYNSKLVNGNGLNNFNKGLSNDRESSSGTSREMSQKDNQRNNFNNISNKDSLLEQQISQMREELSNPKKRGRPKGSISKDFEQRAQDLQTKLHQQIETLGSKTKRGRKPRSYHIEMEQQQQNGQDFQQRQKGINNFPGSDKYQYDNGYGDEDDADEAIERLGRKLGLSKNQEQDLLMSEEDEQDVGNGKKMLSTEDILRERIMQENALIKASGSQENQDTVTGGAGVDPLDMSLKQRVRYAQRQTKDEDNNLGEKKNSQDDQDKDGNYFSIQLKDKKLNLGRDFLLPNDNLLDPDMDMIEDGYDEEGEPSEEQKNNGGNQLTIEEQLMRLSNNNQKGRTQLQSGSQKNLQHPSQRIGNNNYTPSQNIPMLKLQSNKKGTVESYPAAPAQKKLNPALTSLRQRRQQLTAKTLNTPSAVIQNPKKVQIYIPRDHVQRSLNKFGNGDESDNDTKAKIINGENSIRAIPIQRSQDFDQIDIKSILKQIKQEQNSLNNRMQTLQDKEKKRGDSSSSGTSEYDSDAEDVSLTKKNKRDFDGNTEMMDQGGNFFDKKQRSQIKFLQKAKILRDDLADLREQSNCFVFIVRRLAMRVSSFLKYQMSTIEKNLEAKLSNGQECMQEQRDIRSVRKRRGLEIDKLSLQVQLFKEVLGQLPLNKVYLPEEDVYLDPKDERVAPILAPIIPQMQSMINNSNDLCGFGTAPFLKSESRTINHLAQDLFYQNVPCVQEVMWLQDEKVLPIEKDLYLLKGITLDSTAIVKFRLNMHSQMVMDTVCTIQRYCKFVIKHEGRIIADNQVYDLQSGELLQEYTKDKFCGGIGLTPSLLMMAARNQEFTLFRWDGQQYNHDHTVKYCQKFYSGEILLLQKSLFDPGYVFYYLFQKQIIRFTMKSLEILHDATLEEIAVQKMRAIRYFKQIGQNLILVNDRMHCQIINSITKEVIHKFDYPMESRHFCFPTQMNLHDMPFVLFKSSSDLKLADITSKKEKGYRMCKYDYKPIGHIDVSYPESMVESYDGAERKLWNYFMIKDKEHIIRYIKIKLGPELRQGGAGVGAYGKVVYNTQNMHILQINQTSSAEKAGAIKKETLIKAQMQNGEWHSAKILEADFTKGLDDPLIQSALQSKQITQSEVAGIQFKYYVTFIDHNRRLDCWLLSNQIQLLNSTQNKSTSDQSDNNRQKMKDELLKQFNSINSSGSGGLGNHNPKSSSLFDNDEHAGMDKRQMQDHEEATKIKTIRNIELGGHLLQTWYYSPFPREFHQDTIYACDFCLDFFLEKEQKDFHVARCKLRHPPGDEIYRDDKLSVFELDGQLQRIYCENLCLISKLFLDHKTLRYDCSPFRFYVICEPRPDRYQIAGYFSKEKGFVEQNLSCILVLPSYQRKGYGKFLIEFSYELSLIEKRTGTPERPLSDLGFRSYISWWTQRIVSILLEHQDDTISIQRISEITAIDQNDVQYVLENFKIIRRNDLNSKPYLFTQREYLEEILKFIGKPSKKVDRERIHWVPHLIKTNKQ